MENEKVEYKPIAIDNGNKGGLMEGLVLSLLTRNHEGHHGRFEYREEFARDIASRVDQRVWGVEKETLKQGFEDRIKLLEVENKLFGKMDCDKAQVEHKLNAIENDINKKFCDLSHKIEKGFFDCEQKELKSEITKLKEELCASRAEIQTATIISSVLGAFGIAVPPAIPAAKKAA